MSVLFLGKMELKNLKLFAREQLDPVDQTGSSCSPDGGKPEE
jgi:hypothetical protein